MFKQRKNKTFKYKPRFSEENQTDVDLDDNFDSKDFTSKWRRQRGNNVRVKGALPVKTLILVLVLLLLCMYLLEKKYM
ncbi:hypothetical protein Q4Q34_02345 [Flavivirga abyssicola]|uniref:hypothetical protein n=1 Tax=Flavivirga abyssicola TaxID=3063533 RepID=UPI0026DF9ED8|nr:hypothetical protein [Flavivirga sp. MEBiC07777]WVK13876.1 hypothetical protein Q4Q34_02345 [Flavivirga sp. MEBiC07777]